MPATGVSSQKLQITVPSQLLAGPGATSAGDGQHHRPQDGQGADIAQPGQLLPELGARAAAPHEHRGNDQHPGHDPEHEDQLQQVAVPPVTREEPERIRVADVRRDQGVGESAADPGAGLQALRDPGRRDHEQRPGHRAPAARRQPPVREQQDEEQQQYHGELGGRSGQGPDQPGSGHRAARGGQPVQRVLLRERGGRYRYADQAQQPADGVARPRLVIRRPEPGRPGSQRPGSRSAHTRPVSTRAEFSPSRTIIRRSRSTANAASTQASACVRLPCLTKGHATPGPFRERYRRARTRRSTSSVPSAAATWGRSGLCAASR